jgi:hypothetical protein
MDKPIRAKRKKWEYIWICPRCEAILKCEKKCPVCALKLNWKST